MGFDSVMGKSFGRGGVSRTPPDLIRFASNKSGERRDKSCAITIGATLLRRMRWVDGDKLQVQFDTETRMIRIARVVTDRGVKLRVRSKSGAGRTSAYLMKSAMDTLFQNDSRTFFPKPISESSEGLLFPYPS